MEYTSTRNNNININSANVIKQGISADGGLFVPIRFPELSLTEIGLLSGKSYSERAGYIMGSIFDDFLFSEIEDCVNNAYTEEKFGASPAPVKKLSDTAFMLELWHGPTCAFKDMALQILPKLITYSLSKTGEKKTVLILVATSGDTGKAALEGFKDIERTKIFVYYPNEGVSSIQKLQMTAQTGNNVGVCGINGNFDDAQNGVKAIFSDKSIIKELSNKGYFLSSANSINWGRLAPQIVYYISSYCELLVKGEIKLGEKINIAVPTGNFGNILAAYYAGKMGLPINKLICASNVNNVLTEFINEGVYNKNRSFYNTNSPSMDILISSNLERLLFDLLNKDSNKLSLLMNELRQKGSYKIDEKLHKKLKEIFYGGCCDEKSTKMTIKETYENCSYLTDTHTAVAVKVYNDYLKETGDKTKTIIASTASPFKFNKAVLEALTGKEISESADEFRLINELSALTGLEPPKALTELKGVPVRFPDICEKQDMQNKILDFVK